MGKHVDQLERDAIKRGMATFKQEYMRHVPIAQEIAAEEEQRRRVKAASVYKDRPRHRKPDPFIPDLLSELRALLGFSPRRKADDAPGGPELPPGPLGGGAASRATEMRALAKRTMVERTLLRDLAKALRDEGTNEPYHRQQLAYVRQHWPVLYKILVEVQAWEKKYPTSPPGTSDHKMGPAIDIQMNVQPPLIPSLPLSIQPDYSINHRLRGRERN